MTGHFLSNEASPYYQSEIFTAVLKYVQTHISSCRMKEGSGKLSITFQKIITIKDALTVLRKMEVGEIAWLYEVPVYIRPILFPFKKKKLPFGGSFFFLLKNAIQATIQTKLLCSTPNLQLLNEADKCLYVKPGNSGSGYFRLS